MATDLLNLIPRRSGHFRMASGLHGDVWLDLDALLSSPRRLRPHIANLAAKLAESRPDAICGPLVGGALIGLMLAEELDVEFCYSDKSRDRADFAIAPAFRATLAGKRIAIVDDAIQAGSAVRGTISDAFACGATPVALAALIVLGPSATGLADKHGIPLLNLASLDAALWDSADCPLCAAGVPLTR